MNLFNVLYNCMKLKNQPVHDHLKPFKGINYGLLQMPLRYRRNVFHKYTALW